MKTVLAPIGLCFLLTTALQAEEQPLADGAYQLLRKARNDHYNLTFQLTPRPGADTFSRLDLAFGIRSPRDYARFVWGPAGYRLERLRNGKRRELAASPVPLPTHLRTGGRLLLKQRMHSFELIAGGKRVFRILVEGFGRGNVAAANRPEHAAVAKVGYQRVEPVVFGDDFMRTEEEARDLGLWQTVSGQWQVHSVMELIQANPDARIREGREPAADRSPNPFCLSGKAPEGAIVLTGLPFWDDYEMQVSVKSLGSAFGLIFGAADGKSFWYVRWELGSLGVRSRRIALIRRQNGEDEVIGEALAEGRIGNWYRLGVRTIGSRIDVTLDGRRVIQAWSEKSVGGRIGLYAQGEEETLFDDVSVTGVTEIVFDDARLLAGYGEAISGNWKLRGKTGTLRFAALNRRRFGRAGRSLYALGLPTWPPQCFRAQIMPTGKAEAAGLVFGMKNPADYWRAVWAPRSRAIVLSRVKDGTEKELARSALRRKGNSPLDLIVDLRQSGKIRIYADDILHIRYAVDADLSGRTGLYGDSRNEVVFRRVEAFADPRRDWEKPVNVAIFADDPFMQGWASPRYAWIRAPGETGREFPQTFLHKGDFYGAFRLSLPADDGLVLRFGMDELANAAGYALRLAIRKGVKPEGTLTLSKDGVPVRTAPFAPRELNVLPGQQIVDEKIGALPETPDTNSYGELTIERDGKHIWARFEGKEVLAFFDDAPLAGRTVALRIPRKMDFIHVGVVREKLLDYLFERAAVDWVRTGTWEVTNRFACDPRWSHLNGRSKGAAALWHKKDFEGDFTVEYYAGMRMRQGDMMEGAARMYYPRVGDINLALCADGANLFSGCNVLFAAWDPMWTETRTQFWYGEKLLARTEREFIPRGRLARPRTRPIPVEWDPGGRPIHGAWYFVKVRKTGPRFDVFFDNVLVFSATSPQDPKGKRLALWTQHNSIVIARAKIGYTSYSTPDGPERQEELPPPRETRPEPRLSSPSHPGIHADFETGYDDFQPFAGDQSAELSLVPGRSGGQALRLENLYAGGDFGVVLPLKDLDTGRVQRLELDCRIPADVKVNLYFSFLDDPQQRCFVTLSGPDHEAPNLARVGRFEGFKANDKWQHVSIDLAQAVRRAFPWRSNYFATDIMIGMLHEGYLNAGRGGNPRGASYLLDNITVVSAGPMEIDWAWTPTPEKHAPRTQWQLRREGLPQPAFAPDANADDALSQPARVSAPGNWIAWYRYRTKDGWSRVRKLPLLALAPPVRIRTSPAEGQTWDGGAFGISLEPASSPGVDLASLRIRINGIELLVDRATVDYDAASGRLTCMPEFAEAVELAHGDPVEFEIEFMDRATSPPLPEVPGNQNKKEKKKDATDKTPGPAPQPPRRARPRRVFTWRCVMDREADRSPPGPVILDPNFYPRLTFDRGLQGVKPFSGTSRVRFARTVRNKDPKDYALRIVNTLCGSDFGVDFKWMKFPLGSYPILTFDYRTDAFSRSDFLLRILGAKQTIGFTDHDPGNTLELCRAADVRADGEWQHAEVDLGGVSLGRAGTGWGRPLNVTRFALGDWGYSGNAPGAFNEIDNIWFVPVVSSSRGVKLTWTAGDASGIQDYSYTWDADPDTTPNRRPDTRTSEAVFTDVPEGNQWFHIRARDRAGNWGPAAHYRFLVDNTAPAVVGVEPADGSRAAADRIRVRFDGGIAGVDTARIKLAFNGRSYRLSSSAVQWEPATRELRWDLLGTVPQLRQALADGTEMSVKLSGLIDHAGNEAEAFSWSWSVDYGKDTEGPGPPTLWSYSRASQNYDHFTDSVGYWRPYHGGRETTTEIACAKDPDTGNQCLEIRKAGAGRRFGASRYRGKLTLDRFPLLQFDYKIMPGTKINLLLYVDKEWRAIQMTGSDRLPVVGRVPEARDDGTWRRALVDLGELLGKAFPDKKEPNVQLVAFGEWMDKNEIGATAYIDNFAYLGPSSPLPLLNFYASDATGIREFRFAFNQDPEANPDIVLPVTEARTTSKAADAPGVWYIHLQARDGAGNWGDTLHFPYYCTDPVPARDKNGLEAGAPWSVDRKTRGRSHVYSAKAGDKNELLGVRMLTGSRSESVRIVRQASLKLGAEPTLKADFYVDGKYPVQVALAVRTVRGSKWLQSQTENVNPGNWMRAVAFTFDKGAFSGQNRKNADIRDIAFVLTPKHKSRDAILIDQVTVSGSDSD